ncbi:MAG: imidazole glycerol phosphate synthase subunit HisH [Nitrospirae bacterium]|nr:MAG: imidazole glycerol phosphate synthase subunit HisH [Nitrospirota bacterium]
MGNLRSVEKGCKKVGLNVIVTNSPEDVEAADAIILPGVGAFRDCMEELRRLNLVETIINSIKHGKPYLGICLGLQILFKESEEFGLYRGLGIIEGRVIRFPHNELKVPHMGWNSIKIVRRNQLLEGIEDGSYFYFVHSYYVKPENEDVVSTTTEYGITFTSMIHRDNIFAVQFHPEKSQTLGLKMLYNYGKYVESLKDGQNNRVDR